MKQQTFDLSPASPSPPPAAIAAQPTRNEIQIELEDESLLRRMAATYSADTLFTRNTARDFIKYDGRLWVCTGMGGYSKHQNVRIVEVRPGHDIKVPKEGQTYYGGRKITIRGKPYTMMSGTLNVVHKLPDFLPETLTVSDRPGMLHLCQHLSLGIFDGKSKWPQIADLLGCYWLIYEADFSLAIQARLQLVRVEIRSRHNTDPVEIRPEFAHEHPYVGRQLEYANGQTLTCMPEQLTVYCPGSFYTIRKGWIKELNRMPDDDEDFDDTDSLGNLDGIDDTSEEEAETTEQATTPAQPRRKRPPSKLKQQTFF